MEESDCDGEGLDCDGEGLDRDGEAQIVMESAITDSR